MNLLIPLASLLASLQAGASFQLTMENDGYFRKIPHIK